MKELLFPETYRLYKVKDRMRFNLLSRQGLSNFFWTFKVWRNIRWFVFFKNVIEDTLKLR